VGGTPVVPLHRTLDQLAALAGIRGDVAERARFARAAVLVRERAIATDADLAPILESPPADVDAEVLNRLGHMYEAGGWVLLESAIADLPADLRWLFESGAVTIEQLSILHDELGVTSAADLHAELARGTIAASAALGTGVEAAVAAALPRVSTTVPRLPLGRAFAMADTVIAALAATPGIAFAEPTGGVRRGAEMVAEIDIVAPADDPAPAFDNVLGVPEIGRTLHRGPRKLYILIDRVQIGIRAPRLEAAGASLLQSTGTAAHLDALRARATERGCRLEPEGLTRADGVTIAASEESIYAALGLPYIPPELRDGTEAIVSADAGRLPRLVSRTDIRGDLHMHSHYSDGRDSVEAMVRACVELGYEYMAITDHSPHSAASRNLSPDSVARQAEEIASLRARFPQIVILHGCEVDILSDGRLDFSDRILKTFDIVLASLHDGERDSPERLLARYIAAMQHPLVTIVTHPTNRLLPFRAGYDLDYDRLFEQAAETGTVVEVDGAPAHLDLNGELARRAVAAGATLSIDSDSHRTDVLARQMHLGLTMARRGWVEPEHVLNTQTIDVVRRRIAAKRTG
jgi:DNA polymerase (family 10)